MARDYLTDSELSVFDKVPLNALLQKQLTFHVKLLRERLADSHPLKDNITRLEESVSRLNAANNLWHVGSSELAQLNDLLSKLDRKDTPKCLHYLLDNLSYFSGLSDTSTRVCRQ